MNARWLLLGLALLAPGHLPASDVYKWLDDEGAVHYGAQPPLGAKTTRMKVSSGLGAGSAQDAQTSEGGEDADSPPGEEPTGKDKQAAVDPETAASACADAKRNLDILETHGRIRERDGDGNITVLTDAQKEDRINQAKALIEAYCK